jgi:hypothetical protein
VHRRKTVLLPDCPDRSNCIDPVLAAGLVSDFLKVPAEPYAVPVRGKCEKNHIYAEKIRVSGNDGAGTLAIAPKPLKGNASMSAKNTSTLASHRLALALGLALILVSANSASAYQGTAEQRRACTPDVYRLCAGEIPNVRAITACLQRQKGNLSAACRAAMDQNGY